MQRAAKIGWLLGFILSAGFFLQARAEPGRKDFVIHPVCHAHIDMNWLWPWEDTVDTFKINWESMFSRMERHPWFVFVQSQPVMYESLAQVYPDLFRRIRPRVESGNWNIVGGLWDESNTNCPRGEALARSLMLGKRFFRSAFGVRPRVGWLPDSFGMSLQIPQIMKLAGSDYLLFLRCRKRIPIYWWRGPDGSRVLTYNFGRYNSAVERKDLEGLVAAFKKGGGGNRMLFVYGYGDHGGWPSEDELRLIENLNRDSALPARFEFTAVEEYFDLVKNERTDRS